jgi:predicted AlkP superfamily phosphohydrolase/phosphomutase
MPEETNALKDGVFTDDDYLKQVALVQNDTRKMLELALDRFSDGDATFFYVSDIDLQSHVLWRHADPKYPGMSHPARDPVVAEAHAHDIERFYEGVDALLGRVRERLPADTLLIVMSDHGFEPYTQKFHLNAWLRHNGYLVLKDGKRTGHLSDVDWSKTRAYGVGFTGLYLNRIGREAQGIVDAASADGLADELTASLGGRVLQYKGESCFEVIPDAEGHWGNSCQPMWDSTDPVRKVYRASDAYAGERKSEAPDLIVGYDRGFSCSDESTLGEITEALFENNTSRWSGNHLIDPELVPGVLLVNRPGVSPGNDIPDVTATLLGHYGVPPAPGMVGTPFLPAR